MLFLIWYDDSKRPTAEKIRQGCARYAERYGVQPNVVLISTTETAEIDGIEVRPLARIRPNNYHIGVEASDGPPR